jgi:hypothetical protein
MSYFNPIAIVATRHNIRCRDMSQHSFIVATSRIWDSSGHLPRRVRKSRYFDGGRQVWESSGHLPQRVRTSRYFHGDRELWESSGHLPRHVRNSTYFDLSRHLTAFVVATSHNIRCRDISMLIHSMLLDICDTQAPLTLSHHLLREEGCEWSRREEVAEMIVLSVMNPVKRSWPLHQTVTKKTSIHKWYHNHSPIPFPLQSPVPQ